MDQEPRNKPKRNFSWWDCIYLVVIIAAIVVMEMTFEIDPSNGPGTAGSKTITLDYTSAPNE
jgi:hypothetical protein